MVHSLAKASSGSWLLLHAEMDGCIIKASSAEVPERYRTEKNILFLSPWLWLGSH